MFFIFTPYLGKWLNLTNIFQMGWNHQLDLFWCSDHFGQQLRFCSPGSYNKCWSWQQGLNGSRMMQVSILSLLVGLVMIDDDDDDDDGGDPSKKMQKGETLPKLWMHISFVTRWAGVCDQVVAAYGDSLMVLDPQNVTWAMSTPRIINPFFHLLNPLPLKLWHIAWRFFYLRLQLKNDDVRSTQKTATLHPLPRLLLSL